MAFTNIASQFRQNLTTVLHRGHHQRLSQDMMIPSLAEASYLNVACGRQIKNQRLQLLH